MTKLFFSVFTFGLAFSAHASEIAEVEARIAASGYPLPTATIQRLHKIERELTPSALETRSVVLRRQPAPFCDTETVQIFYRLQDDYPVESFTATFTTPHRGPVYRHFVDVRPFPGVVIQPTLAGPTGLENKIARDLCLSGIASLLPQEIVLDLPKRLPDFGAYDRNIRIEMIRARRLVDFFETHPLIDREKIGTIGFSRGALAGALLIGIEPRIQYAFLGAGAVGFATVIARSQTEKGREDNAKQRHAARINQRQFETKLLEKIQYDALLFTHRVDPPGV